MTAPSADAVIAALGLQPHPEGGHFAETYRHVPPEGGRGAMTAIYFLLKAGERSHWHRVDADEIWFWHAGAPLRLSIAAADGTIADHRLGPDVSGGERPQRLVPADAWQAAVSLGDWTLVSCTVAPAFEFAGFELAPPDWQPPGPGPAG
ncbi:MAG: cupin domain-containing protein [Alphaproteobacteria bacterium]